MHINSTIGYNGNMIVIRCLSLGESGLASIVELYAKNTENPVNAATPAKKTTLCARAFERSRVLVRMMSMT